MPFLIAVLVIGGAVVWWQMSRGEKKEYVFETAEVKKGSVTATVLATGTLESTTTVTVGSQVSGPLEDVLVDFNSPVQRGDVLARIEPSEFEARLAQATAGLESARAGFLNAQASLSNADAAIAQARAEAESAKAALSQVRSQVDSAAAAVRNAGAGVERARAEKDNALVQFKRYEELHQRDLVAASELDQAQTTYRVQAAGYETALAAKDESVALHRQALARVEASESDLKAAQTRAQAALAQRQSAQAEVAAAQAAVSQAQASLEQAAVDLERTSIRSPIDGVVIDRKVEVGQTVAASFQAPELFVIAQDLRRMQVRADISESDIGRIDEGQKVTFTVDAYPEREFTGKIIQVRSAPQQGTEASATASNVVVYGVLVDAPNQDKLLKPGMTATVTIYAEQKENVLLVPNEALRFIPPEPEDEEDAKKPGPEKTPGEGKPKPEKTRGLKGTVWVKTPAGAKRRDLTLGITDGKVTEVRGGELKEGETVLTGFEEEPEKEERGFRMRF